MCTEHPRTRHPSSRPSRALKPPRRTLLPGLAITLSMAGCTAEGPVAPEAASFESRASARLPGKFTFQSIRGDGIEIYAMNADGTEQTRLTTSRISTGADWSPDGRQIVFATGESGLHLRIHTMNADGSGLRRLTDGPDYLPTWSRDGKRIAFNRILGNRFQVFVMDADGSNQSQLTDEPHGALAGDWTSDGRIILEVRLPLGESRIWRMAADGSERVQLTDEPGYFDGRPSWSPVGIAFARRKVGERFDIWVMKPDGSGQHRLTDNTGIDDWPTWLPGGRRIAFEEHTGSHGTQIAVIDVDGGGRRLITTSHHNSRPRWGRGMPVR